MKGRDMDLDQRLTQLRDGAVEIRRFLTYVVGRLGRDGALRMASALSYTSLLGLVPLLAIGLAILAAFPVFAEIRGQLQSFIFENFVPEVGAAVSEQVGGFVANTDQLTAIGIIGLVVTSILLLITIETALNDIFRVVKPRSPLWRILVYWTLLTLGPLLIGASFSLQTYFMAAGRWFQDVGGSAGLVTRLLPIVLTTIAITLAYVIIPNRAVKIRDALMGGIFAGVLFAILRFAFSYYVAGAETYRTIYGAVAVVPIFLTWLYLSWTVILLGAEITAALPEWRAGEAHGDGRAPVKKRLALALEVLSVLWRASQTGTAGTSRSMLLNQTGAAERDLLGVIDRLRDHGFIARAAGNRLILSRDLATATLRDVVETLEIGLGNEDVPARRFPWWPDVEARIDRAAAAEREPLSVSLRDLLSQGEGAAEPVPEESAEETG